MPNVGAYTKKMKKKKISFAILFTKIETRILDTGSLKFEKENKSTQGYLVFGLPVRGGHAIYLPKYK